MPITSSGAPPACGDPVYPGYFADPYVWRCPGGFCAIGTGPAEASGRVEDGAGAGVFPLLHSADLSAWHFAGHALLRPDPALGSAFWAPEVASADGHWFLYYSVGHGDAHHQLRVAVSRDALGPYRDAGALTDPRDVPFAIDPHPFRDSDGRWYLFHARDFLDEVDEAGRPVRPGTALVVHALEDMTRLATAGRTVARARHDWQRYAANRRMYGRDFDWHTLEGPSVVAHAGRYYCLYSGGCWQTDGYGVDYVVADTLAGPWRDEGAEAGPRVLRSVPGRVLGPGHCSVVTGADGRCYVAYHAWDAGMDARRMRIDELVFTPEGPRALGRCRAEPGPAAGARG